ncbi:MAG: DUF4411 family protein [Candidatus Omnitrophica bacterium]|nr:DUF4411 family protein [Candidatus Omnitrophota bacterium]MCF7897397.1 DUF4411 family protein [Candidatus Omnitrophota bacterium]MCF7909496.1 DUF4411 family protein [Candidatus Omnitrophota bacterium]
MKKYCLDTNVFIEPWNKYYSMDLAPNYWDMIDGLAKKGVIFCTEFVKKEILKTDDHLSDWVKKRPYLFKPINEEVQKHLRVILRKHERLVDSSKSRSMADPWVIAHAIAEQATVVTKEDPAPSLTKKIKMPDVCKALNVECINDFEFLAKMGVQFKATFKG